MDGRKKRRKGEERKEKGRKEEKRKEILRVSIINFAFLDPQEILRVSIINFDSLIHRKAIQEYLSRSSHCGSVEMNLTSIPEDESIIPGLTQCVQDPALP